MVFVHKEVVLAVADQLWVVQIGNFSCSVDGSEPILK